ncbi:hypothetical protein PCE1_000844 [Barthelona sp. PCE]
MNSEILRKRLASFRKKESTSTGLPAKVQTKAAPKKKKQFFRDANKSGANEIEVSELIESEPEAPFDEYSEFMKEGALSGKTEEEDFETVDLGDEFSDEDEELQDLILEKKAEDFMNTMLENQRLAQEDIQEQMLEEDSSLITNVSVPETYKVNDDQILMKDTILTLDRTVLREEIDNALRTLANFKSIPQEKRPSRSQLISQLKTHLSAFYGWLPSLIDRFFNMFSIDEVIAFLEAAEMPRPTTIRVNTLKARVKDVYRYLTSKGAKIKKVPWAKECLQIVDSQVRIGGTASYLTGNYMLQTAASLMPVIALDPKPGMKCLDMACAPGGKTAHMAALMKNRGELIANDLRKDRLVAVFANLHRLGVRIASIINFDGKDIPENIGLFDRVLLDAPCSGLGVIDRDPSAKLRRNDKDIGRSSHLQRELIRKAFAMVKPGGYMVYSTCSILCEENEGVVDYLIKRCSNAKIVDSGLEFGENGFTRIKTHQYSNELAKTKRYYPHRHNFSGFYVAKIQKVQ